MKKTPEEIIREKVMMEDRPVYLEEINKELASHEYVQAPVISILKGMRDAGELRLNFEDQAEGEPSVEYVGSFGTEED
jgi:hypothetical protein